jgi:F0F1-type ATP synthase membrane subunit b/b'
VECGWSETDGCLRVIAEQLVSEMREAARAKLAQSTAHVEGQHEDERRKAVLAVRDQLTSEHR